MITVQTAHSAPSPDGPVGFAARTGDLRVEALGSRRSATDLLILPTLNEEDGLAFTLNELVRVPAFPGGRLPDVLVVDGGSSDRTPEVARRAGVRVLPQSTSGKGSAVREALEWAAAHGFERVGTIDADGTYPCDRLPGLFELLRDGREVVIGVRRPTEPTRASVRDLVHRTGNVMLNACATEFARGPVLDVCSGFWGLRTAVLSRLGLRSDGFEIESELFMKAFHQGFDVAQIPIEYRPRIGTAKLRAGRDGPRILLSIIRNARRGVRGLRPSSAWGVPSSVARLRWHDPRWRSVLLSLDPDQIRVVTVPERFDEAAGIAQALAPRDPKVELVPPGGDSTPAGIWAGLPDAPSSPSTPSRPVVIALTLDGAQAPGWSSVLLGGPQRGALVYLGGTPDLDPAPPEAAVPSARRRAGWRRSLGAFSLLAAMIDPSGVQQQVTLLTANLSGAGVDVRRVREGPARWLGSRLARGSSALEEWWNGRE